VIIGSRLAWKASVPKGIRGSSPLLSAFGRHSFSVGDIRHIIFCMSKDGVDDKGRPSADAVRFYYVYILMCGDNEPYTGCTDDLRERITRHQNGQVPATKNRLPIKLIAYFAFSNKYTAFNFKKYLKSGSGRAFLKKHEIVN
jgi:putative endonuclease